MKKTLQTNKLSVNPIQNQHSFNKVDIDVIRMTLILLTSLIFTSNGVCY